MRVSLVSSVNLASWYDQEREAADPSPPMGLLALAASLRLAGHTPILDDVNGRLHSGELRIGSDFYDSVVAGILDADPDIVGFSTLCSSYHLTLRLAERLKTLRPDLPTLLGGPQASVAVDPTLRAFPAVDFVLCGEADATLPTFVAEIGSRTHEYATPGLAWRDGDTIRQNPAAPPISDLDRLPLPAYDLLAGGPGKATAIDAGRGCPFGCTFCSTSRYWRRHYRLKSLDRVLWEASQLHELYGTTSFSFLHDLFTLNRPRVREFCDRLTDERRDWRWSCSARVDCIDADLLKRMAGSGCHGVFYGIETGSARMQKVIGKNLKIDQALSTIDATVEAGIVPTASFIAGFPTETEDDIADTFALIQELLRKPNVNIQLHLLGPEAATADYATYRDRLRFDGYYSDITGTSYRLLEPEWFRRWPDLFSSYYYYENPAFPRALQRGADLFVHATCSFMRRTVNALVDDGRSLWALYRAWHDWADERSAGRGPVAGQLMDEYLLDFCEFVEAEASAGRTRVDPGVARDEMLAYYIQSFGLTPVRFSAASDPDGRVVAGLRP